MTTFIDFVIVGAAKSGTTGLYEYLKHHPNICMSKTKETNFFIEPNWKLGEEWFQNQFISPEKIKGEASPRYTQYNNAPQAAINIKNKNTKTKIIYIVRDPIDRIQSHIHHNMIHRNEKRTVKDILKDPENEYILASKYYYQIKPFLANFSRKNIFIIQQEHLNANPNKVLNDICSFLNTTPFKNLIIQERHNISANKVRRTKLGQFVDDFKLEFLLLKIKKFIPEKIKNTLSGIFNYKIKKPDLKEYEKMLQDNLSSDLEIFDKEFNVNYDSISKK